MGELLLLLALFPHCHEARGALAIGDCCYMDDHTWGLLIVQVISKDEAGDPVGMTVSFDECLTDGLLTS